MKSIKSVTNQKKKNRGIVEAPFIQNKIYTASNTNASEKLRNGGEFSWAGSYRALGRGWEKDLQGFQQLFILVLPPLSYLTHFVISLLIGFLSLSSASPEVTTHCFYG